MHGVYREDAAVSTRLTKTIDDLGIGAYTRYEEDKMFFEEKFLSDSKEVAYQLATDVFEPIMEDSFKELFDLGARGAPWGLMRPPPKYNQQKRRLFTHQLGPKFGPEELLDTQMERIEWQKDKEKKDREGKRKGAESSWEEEKDLEEIAKEGKKLIELLQDINILNKIIQDINSERYRYNKG
jgi:hypothetical protein